MNPFGSGISYGHDCLEIPQTSPDSFEACLYTEESYCFTLTTFVTYQNAVASTAVTSALSNHLSNE